MKICALDHVNIKTSNLSAMVAYYRDVLGFRLGERPSFKFDGAWLYCKDQAVIHLVKVRNQPNNLIPQIDHFAFRCEGLEELLLDLCKFNCTYRVRSLPERQMWQVFTTDPDKNNLELQFSSAETVDKKLLS